MTFQNPASSYMYEYIVMHNKIIDYLIPIFFLVLWLFTHSIFYSLYTFQLRESKYAPLLFSKSAINEVKHRRSKVFDHCVLIEFLWTILPIFYLESCGISGISYIYSSSDMSNEVNNWPDHVLKIHGYQWYWEYDYSGLLDKSGNSIRFSSNYEPLDPTEKKPLNLSGRTTKERFLEVDNRVVLPKEADIKVLVSSSDVIHSWAIPPVGSKMDCIPGRLNQFTINITKYGLYKGQCSEFCGVGHGFMPIVVQSCDILDYWSYASKTGSSSITNELPVFEESQKVSFGYLYNSFWSYFIWRFYEKPFWSFESPVILEHSFSKFLLLCDNLKNIIPSLIDLKTYETKMYSYLYKAIHSQLYSQNNLNDNSNNTVNLSYDSSSSSFIRQLNGTKISDLIYSYDNSDFSIIPLSEEVPNSTNDSDFKEVPECASDPNFFKTLRYHNFPDYKKFLSKFPFNKEDSPETTSDFFEIKDFSTFRKAKGLLRNDQILDPGLKKFDTSFAYTSFANNFYHFIINKNFFNEKQIFFDKDLFLSSYRVVLANYYKDKIFNALYSEDLDFEAALEYNNILFNFHKIILSWSEMQEKIVSPGICNIRPEFNADYFFYLMYTYFTYFKHMNSFSPDSKINLDLIRTNLLELLSIDSIEYQETSILKENDLNLNSNWAVEDLNIFSRSTNSILASSVLFKDINRFVHFKEQYDISNDTITDLIGWYLKYFSWKTKLSFSNNLEILEKEDYTNLNDFIDSYVAHLHSFDLPIPKEEELFDETPSFNHFLSFYRFINSEEYLDKNLTCKNFKKMIQTLDNLNINLYFDQLKKLFDEIVILSDEETDKIMRTSVQFIKQTSLFSILIDYYKSLQICKLMEEIILNYDEDYFVKSSNFSSKELSAYDQLSNGSQETKTFFLNIAKDHINFFTFPYSKYILPESFSPTTVMYHEKEMWSLHRHVEIKKEFYFLLQDLKSRYIQNLSSTLSNFFMFDNYHSLPTDFMIKRLSLEQFISNLGYDFMAKNYPDNPILPKLKEYANKLKDTCLFERSTAFFQFNDEVSSLVNKAFSLFYSYDSSLTSHNVKFLELYSQDLDSLIRESLSDKSYYTEDFHILLKKEIFSFLTLFDSKHEYLSVFDLIFLKKYSNLVEQIIEELQTYNKSSKDSLVDELLLKIEILNSFSSLQKDNPELNLNYGIINRFSKFSDYLDSLLYSRLNQKYLLHIQGESNITINALNNLNNIELEKDPFNFFFFNLYKNLISFQATKVLTNTIVNNGKQFNHSVLLLLKRELEKNQHISFSFNETTDIPDFSKDDMSDLENYCIAHVDKLLQQYFLLKPYYVYRLDSVMKKNFLNFFDLQKENYNPYALGAYNTLILHKIIQENYDEPECISCS